MHTDTCTHTHTGSSLALAHTHIHWMLRHRIFSCTCPHWMLRHRIFSCTCTHRMLPRRGVGSSLALAHTLDAAHTGCYVVGSGASHENRIKDDSHIAPWSTFLFQNRQKRRKSAGAATMFFSSWWNFIKSPEIPFSNPLIPTRNSSRDIQGKIL